MNEDLAKLFAIWEHAIKEQKKEPSKGFLIAENAMSLGSYFSSYIDADPLLEEIHYEFGSLEVEYDDPENRWGALADKIAEAKAKYSA